MNAKKVLRALFSPCSPHLSNRRLQAGPQAVLQTPAAVNTHRQSTAVLNSDFRPCPSPTCHRENQAHPGDQRYHLQPLRNCLCVINPLKPNWKQISSLNSYFGRGETVQSYNFISIRTWLEPLTLSGY